MHIAPWTNASNSSVEGILFLKSFSSPKDNSLAVTILFIPCECQNLALLKLVVFAWVLKCNSMFGTDSFAINKNPGSEIIIASTPILSRYLKYSEAPSKSSLCGIILHVT